MTLIMRTALNSLGFNARLGAILTWVSAGAAPVQAADPPTRFTRLAPLPPPRIVASATAYPGGAFNVANLLDADPRTEYSSASLGTNTFVRFDFGQATAIAGFRHVDRNDPATVQGSELAFADAEGRAVTNITVVHANARAGVTIVTWPRAIPARQVTWRVTKLGPQNYATVGGAELVFFSAAPQETLPRQATLTCRALPVLQRAAPAPRQAARIVIDYPYAEAADALLRVEGLDARPLQLRTGHLTVDLALPLAPAERLVHVRLEVAGQTVSTNTLRQSPVRPMTVYVLPHSHVDIGYTELQTDVEQKQMRNLARGIELARATAHYPAGARYKWNVEVLWAVESYLRQQPRERQAEFIAAVQRGDVGLQAMYANLLTGLCRPEELLRAFRLATDLAQQWGVPVDAAMISDVPGYTWGTVQAMAQAGVKYFSIAPNYFDRIGTTLIEWENKPFWWVAANGRDQVLCWVPYYGYALSHVIQDLKESFLIDFAAKLDERQYPYDIAYLRWSGHGDNATPDERLPDYVRAWNEKYASPRLIIATASEAFRAFDQRWGAHLPKVRGDWTPYWEDGAGSSARETALNRASADRLIEAETMFALLQPDGFPTARFHAAWRNVLLYSEHTWGAHNSISAPDLPFVTNQWAIKQGFALAADRESRALLEAASAGRGERVADALDVFNMRAASGAVEPVIVPAAWSTAGDAVVASGESIGETVAASQRLATGELLFLARQVPAWSGRRYEIRRGPAAARRGAPCGVGVDGLTLTNESLTVRVDARSGAIVSLRTGGHEYVDPEAAGGLNEYLYLPGKDLKAVQRNGPVKVTIKERGPVLASLAVESAAPGCRRLTREIRLCAGLPWVELINTVDKAPVRAKEGLHFGFAFGVPDGVVRMDVPWATVRPEADQIPGACKNWFTVGNWVDVSNTKRGITWLTRDAPLVEVGGLTATLLGSQHDPKAWREHVGPTQTIYSWVMNNHWHTNYRAEQEGPTVFRYFLWPHAGRYQPESLARLTPVLTRPLLVLPAGGAPPRPAPFTVSPADVTVTALKPSDDGRAWIVRLFGTGSKTKSVTLHWTTPGRHEVWLSDTTERALRPLTGPVPVTQASVVTLRVARPK
jgi:hypothetical protein